MEPDKRSVDCSSFLRSRRCRRNVEPAGLVRILTILLFSAAASCLLPWAVRTPFLSPAPPKKERPKKGTGCWLSERENRIEAEEKKTTDDGKIVIFLERACNRPCTRVLFVLIGDRRGKKGGEGRNLFCSK